MADETYRQRCADAVDRAAKELAGIWDNVIIMVNSQNDDEGTICHSRHEGNAYAVEAQVKHYARSNWGPGPRGVNYVDRPSYDADDDPESSIP